MVTHETYVAEQTERSIILRDGLIEKDARNGNWSD
jgi:ABC-type lipoprotein export system ATPase subunit